MGKENPLEAIATNEKDQQKRVLPQIEAFKAEMAETLTVAKEAMKKVTERGKKLNELHNKAEELDRRALFFQAKADELGSLDEDDLSFSEPMMPPK